VLQELITTSEVKLVYQLASNVLRNTFVLKPQNLLSLAVQAPSVQLLQRVISNTFARKVSTKMCHMLELMRAYTVNLALVDIIARKAQWFL
jgi:hypothetical protein